MTMTFNEFFSPPLDEELPLPRQGSWPKTAHRFDLKSVWAVRAAIASNRPLLLRGEPGIGKSQLARAVAEFEKVPFLPFVIDERTERDDLFYTFDAVARLAQAHVSSIVAKSVGKNVRDWRALLAEQNFFRPGVLWWAFAPDEARTQALIFSEHCRRCDDLIPPERKPNGNEHCSCVVLIDEIDKADPSVPNGLLECLGNQGFQTPQLGKPVELTKGTKPPLVIITTNEDRDLPPAFLRRCLVLHMVFDEDPVEAERFLIRERARVNWLPDVVSDRVCQKVVERLLEERKASRRNGLTVPGAAEFLDIVRVLAEMCPGDEAVQLDALTQISEFALKKTREERP